MKSKIVLLKEKMEKEKAKFQGYIDLMEKAIEEKYPKGYKFDVCPFSDRFLYYGDVDDRDKYYTRLEEVYVKAIERTKGFGKIADAIKRKGYKYEFTTSVSHSYSRAEWKIYIHIKKDEHHKEVQKYVSFMEKVLQEKYPNGLDFNEIPYLERIIYDSDISSRYYTGIEKIYIRAIQETKSFKRMAKELIKKGYDYEFKAHVNYGSPKTEWQINLIIK